MKDEDDGDVTADPHGMQYNEKLTAHLMHLHGDSWADPRNAQALAMRVNVPFVTVKNGVVVPDGTYNQNAQGRSVGLGEHVRDELAQKARDEIREWLKMQVDHGHGALGPRIETFSNTHFPHVMGAVSSGLTTSLDLRLPDIRDGFIQWCSYYMFLIEMHLIPTGPLRFRSVGVCGRFGLPGWKDERDVWYSLIKTGRASKGWKYWKKAEGAQDTWPCLMTKRLVERNDSPFGHWVDAEHGDHKWVCDLKPVAPKLPDGISIACDRYQYGHVSRVVTGSFGAKDPLSVCVQYATGNVSMSLDDRTGDSLPIGALGARLSTVRVPTGGAGAP